VRQNCSSARKGLGSATNDITRADFSFHLGHSLWLQNRAKAALPYLEQALALRQEQQDPFNVAEITTMLGGLLFEVNRFSESEDMLKQAERCYKALGRDFERANVLNELAINALKQGYPKKALDQLLEAETIFKKVTGVGYDYIDVLHVTSVCWVFLAEESRFLNTIEQALTLSARAPTGFSGALHLSVGHFYTRMGESEKAEESFQQVLNWPGLPTYYRPAALRGLARIRVLTGHDPSSLFSEVERLLRDVGNPTQDVCAFLLLKAQWVQVSDAVKLATKATKLALANGFMGEAILSLTRSAQVLLASGKLKRHSRPLDKPVRFSRRHNF
jgi:tetratricopeptide (TPR) repeat protein